MAPQQINWAIYNSLPPKEAQYQLTHIHDSRKASTAVAYTICITIASIAIMMRFMSKRIGRTPYGADDWTMVAAYILALAYATPALLGTFKYGGGRHTILMAETDPVNFAKALFAAELIYAPAMAAVKISTLLLFARIFPDPKFKRFLWAIGIFVSTCTAINLLVDLFQCKPVQGAWNSSLDADCIQIKSVAMVMGAMNVLTDFALLFAPIPQLWNLHLRKDTKIELIGIFSIGGFVTVVSIYRIPKLNSLSALDAGWSDIGPSVWSMVEVCVAILCASTITYRPLFNWACGLHPSPVGSAARIPKPSVTGLPYPKSTPSNKSIDVRMQALNPPSATRPSGHGDGFYRMEDSPDT